MAGSGRVLYDTVMMRLDSQKESQAALISRGKDLLGLTSIAGTITSVVAGRQVFEGVNKPPTWWVWCAAGAVGVAILSALWVFRPRKWVFAPDPSDLADRMLDPAYAEAEPDDWYRAIAKGFLTEKPRRRGLFLIERLPTSDVNYNAGQLGNLSLLVTIQTAALAALVVLAFILFVVL